MNNNISTILVTGAGGQLGNEIRAIAASYPMYRFLFTTRNELAIEDKAALISFFSANPIDFCINCAAYTMVDKAETEEAQAFLINATAAGYLAEVCRLHKTKLIHISTDYVFDGSADTPYTENSPTSPVSVYGISKLTGESLVLDHDPAATIIRTSWVYSAFGNNFVKTMLRLMKERNHINVVNDQFGCPTYAADLAVAIMEIIEKCSTGKCLHAIFNYCNDGAISWYNFAVAIKELTGSTCTINPIPTSDYPTAAKRPHYSVLDTTRFRETFHKDIPGWRESLEKCLVRLNSNL